MVLEGLEPIAFKPHHADDQRLRNHRRQTSRLIWVYDGGQRVQIRVESRQPVIDAYIAWADMNTNTHDNHALAVDVGPPAPVQVGQGPAQRRRLSLQDHNEQTIRSQLRLPLN